MTIGKIFFDNSTTDKIIKLSRAAQAYAKQFGGQACGMILVNKDFLAGIEPALLLPLPFHVLEYKSVLPHHFWAVKDLDEVFKDLIMDTKPDAEER